MLALPFARKTKDPLLPEGFRINIYTLLFTSLAINVLSLAMPVMTLQVYDRILPNTGSGTLPVLIAGVLIALVLEAALRLSRAYMVGWAGASFEHRLSSKMMKHILNANLTHISHFGTSEYLQRMGAPARLKDFYNGYSAMTLFELLFLPIFLALIWYISGPLVIAPLTVLCLFVLVSFAKGKRLKALLENREASDDKRFNFLIETLEGARTLKAFALEKIFERRYEHLEEQSCLKNFDVTVETSSIHNISAIFSQLMVVCVVTAGAVFVMNGQLTTGGLIAILLLSGRVMQPVQRAVILWTRYQDYLLSRQTSLSLLTTPERSDAFDTSPKVAEGRLDIEGLHFRYSDHSPWLIRDLNLSLTKGDTLLIDGVQGSGKTTLLKMIAGIYAPISGKITVDGTDISAYPPAELHRHVGYIRSEDLIFRGSIRDNITCFGQRPEHEARDMAERLKVDRDVARMPSGYDTFLNGNASDSIPPGLKQRICMVRILASRPKIILFDNADRSLDREGYDLVYYLLSKIRGRATLILISDDHNIRSLATRSLNIESATISDTNDAQRHQPQNYEELTF